MKYKTLTGGLDYKEVNGKPLSLDIGKGIVLDCFTYYQNAGGRAWYHVVLVDPPTSLGSAFTRQDAIEKAIERIQRCIEQEGIEGFNNRVQAVRDQIKDKYGPTE